MERASEAADTEPKRRFRGKSGDIGGGRANGEYINLGRGGRNIRVRRRRGDNALIPPIKETYAAGLLKSNFKILG